MKANRRYELIVTRDGIGPAFLAGRERTDRIELVSLDDGEVVLFWQLPAREASRLLRRLRADLASQEDVEFLERWRRRAERA